MVVSSTLSHTLQGVPEMQCPKGTRWVSDTRMEVNSACHDDDVFYLFLQKQKIVYDGYPRNECGPRVSRQVHHRQ
jgi:hypothetical protein